MTQARGTDNAMQIEIYRRMFLLKANDDRVRKELMAGNILAPYYSYRGQECIPAALSVNLTDSDYLCTIYRGVHDMLAKGFPLPELWAELMGRATGACKGKGGCMHLTNPQKGIMVTTGIVGSSTVIANGLAWAAQMSKDGRVAVATFGDGAANIGAFHEALNLASIWKLPVIFLCQNNLFGEHTRYQKVTGGGSISERAKGYGIHGVQVDGNDPLRMFELAQEAVARARSGRGPTLIEAMTFRFHGHVFGDADAYMDPEQKKAAIAADPVPRFRAFLVDSGVATEDEISAIEKQELAEIDAAVRFAIESPYPSEEELLRDVYAQGVAA